MTSDLYKRILQNNLLELLEALESNEGVAIDGAFGSGKTFLKDEFVKKLEDPETIADKKIKKAFENSSLKGYTFIEINAFDSNVDLKQSLLDKMKEKDQLKKKILVSHRGGGLFFIKNWELSFIILPILFSICLPFFIEIVVRDWDFFSYGDEDARKTFWVFFGVLLSFLAYFLIISIVSLFKIKNLRKGYYFKKNSIEKTKFIFIIEDLNRLNNDDQYEYLKAFYYLVLGMKIENKKIVTLLDFSENNDRKKDLTKFFGHTIHIIYSYGAKKQIITEMIVLNNNENSKEFSSELNNVLELERNFPPEYLTNLDLLVKYFSNFRTIEEIITKLKNYLKNKDFNTKINLNDLFDFLILEKYDYDLYSLILKNPMLITSKLEKSISKPEFSPDEEEYLNFITFNAKNQDKVNAKYKYFEKTIFKKQFLNSNTKNDTKNMLIDITDIKYFDYFINPRWFNLLEPIVKNIKKISNEVDNYSKILNEIIKNWDTILSLPNWNNQGNILYYSSDFSLIFSEIRDSFHASNLIKFKELIVQVIEINFFQKKELNSFLNDLEKFIISENINFFNQWIKEINGKNFVDYNEILFTFWVVNQYDKLLNDNEKLNLYNENTYLQNFEVNHFLEDTDFLKETLLKIKTFSNNDHDFVIRISILERNAVWFLRSAFCIEEYKELIKNVFKFIGDNGSVDENDKLLKIVNLKILNINENEIEDKCLKEFYEFINSILNSKKN